MIDNSNIMSRVMRIYILLGISRRKIKDKKIVNHCMVYFFEKVQKYILIFFLSIFILRYSRILIILFYFFFQLFYSTNLRNIAEITKILTLE